MPARARDDATEASERAPSDRRAGATPTSAPAMPSAAAMLQLQRLAGNRAVARVVQRDRTDQPTDAGVPVPGGLPAAPSEAPRLPAGPALPKPGDAKPVSTGQPLSPAPAPRGAPPEPAPLSEPPVAAGNAVTFGQDWEGFFGSVTDPLHVFRSLMECLRPIPSGGLVAGFAADAVNTYEDIMAVQKVDAPVTTLVVVIRDSCMIVNNGLGSLASTVEWVQDFAAGSGVGAPVVAVTGPIEAALKGVKLWFDGVQLSLDVLIAGAADYNAARAPAGPELDAWNAILTNFEANYLGDGLSMIIDAVDYASLGFANGENLKGVTKAVYNVFLNGSKFKQAFLGILQGWFGVVGGDLPLLPRRSGTPAPVQRDTIDSSGLGDAAADAGVELTSDAILAELAQIRAAYEIGDVLMSGASAVIGDLTARLNETATELLGGQDPFQVFKAKSQEMVTRMQGTIGELGRMQVFAGTADEKAGYLIRLSDDLLGTLDRLVIPEIHVDRMLDDGVLATVVNAASGLADGGLQVMLGRVRSAVDSAKESARTPVLQVRGNAEEIAQFAQFLQQHTVRAIQLFEGKIASFNTGLSNCQTFTDVVNLLLRQITEALGMGEGVSIEDIQREWREIPALLDQAEAWARGLHRVSPGEPEAGDSAPPVADVPQPPQPPDEDAA